METSEAPAAGRFWRVALPVAVAACLSVNYVYNFRPPAGALSNGQMSARHPTLLTPAGWAFSIWGLIFTGLVLYAIWQALPRQRTAALPAVLNPPLTLAVLATTAWTLVFSYEHVTLSLFVMLTILVALAVAYARARPLVRAGAAPGWATFFLPLYLGWIMLATVLNVIFGLRDGLGWVSSAVVGFYLSYALLAVAAGLGAALAWRARDPLLPLPLAWGLLGTAAAARATGVPLAMAAQAAATLLGVAVGVLLAQRWREAQGATFEPK